jgi:hypothetical protein
MSKNIIFNHAISNIRVYPKVEDWLTNYKVVNDFKLRVGYKFFIIPVYKIIPKAVVRGLAWEFVCDTNEFKHDRLFIEDDKFYYRPHCTIFLNNKSHQDVYFDSVEELNSYVDEIKSKAPHIIF